MKATLRAVALCGVIFAGAQAQAQEPQVQADLTERWRPSFGARIGGYGFRELKARAVSWTDCRMDGAGVFGAVDLSEHLFAELSFDFYGASAILVGELEAMDRVSAHTQGALGLRMATGGRFVPYLQVGGGAEWTRVDMPGFARTQGWFPTGFFGVGGELALTDHLRLGASLRVAAMAHPLHAHGGEGAHEGHALGHGALPAPAAAPRVQMEYAPAGQALFLVRYSL
jgi:hypothetical protein